MDLVLQLLTQYQYVVLFPLACIEGPIVALVSGFLVHTGQLQFIPTFFILILGDLIPDTIYFYIGRSGHKYTFIEKYSSRFRLISSNTSLITHLWTNHARKMMFFGKLAYGLSVPFIISAGLVKMPYKKFIRYTVPASFFQYGLIMAIGYFTGYSYAMSQPYIENTYIIIAICLIIVISVYVGISKYAKNKIEEIEKTEETKNNK